MKTIVTGIVTQKRKYNLLHVFISSISLITSFINEVKPLKKEKYYEIESELFY